MTSKIEVALTVNGLHQSVLAPPDTPLVPSAISNAVFQLTGVRLRQQPMLAGRVKQALLEPGNNVA